MTSIWTRLWKDAVSQPIVLCTGIHLALEPLQAVDLPFEGALTPEQRLPSLDGGIILRQSLGKALKWREGGCRGARLATGGFDQGFGDGTTRWGLDQ
jgi:hypothetical protein